jgi:hypothetical protein
MCGPTILLCAFPIFRFFFVCSFSRSVILLQSGNSSTSPISTCNRGATRDHYSHLPTSLIVVLLALAELSLGVGGRMSCVMVSSAKILAWLTAGVVMVIVFVGVALVIVLLMVGISQVTFVIEDIPPIASVASISRSLCSNNAFFFLSVFRLVFCCLKFIAYFFVVTEHVDVAPVFPVMSIR